MYVVGKMKTDSLILAMQFFTGILVYVLFGFLFKIFRDAKEHGYLKEVLTHIVFACLFGLASLVVLNE